MIATIITVHENPYPKASRTVNSQYEPSPELEVLRGHIISVLNELSGGADTKKSRNPLFTLTIRSVSTPSSPSEASSKLFYYIFDDWTTSYSLVAEGEHQYGTQLENLVFFPLIVLLQPLRITTARSHV